MNTVKRDSVLVVEDERIVARDLEQTLAELGYHAAGIASSAEEAIAHASKRCPDLVLMDIRIRGKRDGVETADLLRRQFDVPIVYLTAHADDATLERAKRSEPYAYLLKPVKAAELRSAIEVALYRHGIEKRLRERERWFSTTLRSIADAVVTVDLAGKITFMNPSAERLTGKSMAEAVGRPAGEVVRLLGASRAPLEQTPLDQALEEGRVVELHEARLVGSGEDRRIIVSDSAAPVVDKGQLLGAVMVFRDVTEEKMLQKQLELSDRLSSLGTMAAGVAHEINNPLAVVLGNASYLQDKLAEVRAAIESNERPSQIVGRLDEVSQVQTEVQISARRIARIVADLKAFARPVPQSADSADVQSAVDWAVRATATEFRHRAIVSMDIAELPLAGIDEVRLGQVLVNLLLNAAHAISPGNVRANEVVIRAKLDDHGFIILELRDSGSGIPPEIRERVFEPFFTTKPVGVGTGLGLSICHGIVRSVGGEISVESDVGKGTTFRIRLPPAPQKPQTTPDKVLPLSASRRGRILVVDDEESVLRTVQRILANHDVVCTTSARDALNRIEGGEHFDVILSDVMMPATTGIQLYETLLAEKPEQAAKVVFMSGGAITRKVEDFLGTVRNARVEKPFDVETLRDVVELALERPEPEASSP
jgi:two-component system cell cycle sensor histidine kinase/response regulator CckA